MSPKPSPLVSRNLTATTLLPWPAGMALLAKPSGFIFSDTRHYRRPEGADPRRVPVYPGSGVGKRIASDRRLPLRSVRHRRLTS
jgi:hypothetical protein